MDNKTAVKNLEQAIDLLDKVVGSNTSVTNDDWCEVVNRIWEIIYKLENPND